MSKKKDWDCFVISSLEPKDEDDRKYREDLREQLVRIYTTAEEKTRILQYFFENFQKVREVGDEKFEDEISEDEKSEDEGENRKERGKKRKRVFKIRTFLKEGGTKFLSDLLEDAHHTEESMTLLLEVIFIVYGYNLETLKTDFNRRNMELYFWTHCNWAHRSITEHLIPNLLSVTTQDKYSPEVRRVAAELAMDAEALSCVPCLVRETSHFNCDENLQAKINETIKSLKSGPTSAAIMDLCLLQSVTGSWITDNTCSSLLKLALRSMDKDHISHQFHPFILRSMGLNFHATYANSRDFMNFLMACLEQMTASQICPHQCHNEEATNFAPEGVPPIFWPNLTLSEPFNRTMASVLELIFQSLLKRNYIEKKLDLRIYQVLSEYVCLTPNPIYRACECLQLTTKLRGNKTYSSFRNYDDVENQEEYLDPDLEYVELPEYLAEMFFYPAGCCNLRRALSSVGNAVLWKFCKFNNLGLSSEDVIKYLNHKERVGWYSKAGLIAPFFLFRNRNFLQFTEIQINEGMQQKLINLIFVELKHLDRMALMSMTFLLTHEFNTIKTFSDDPCQVQTIEDVQFQGSEGQLVGAVKSYLTRSEGYFRAMLCDNFKEASLPVIPMNNYPTCVLRVAVHLKYGCGCQCQDLIQGFNEVIEGRHWMSMWKTLNLFMITDDENSDPLKNYWGSCYVPLRTFLLLLPFQPFFDFEARRDCLRQIFANDDHSAENELRETFTSILVPSEVAQVVQVQDDLRKKPSKFESETRKGQKRKKTQLLHTYMNPIGSKKRRYLAL